MSVLGRKRALPDEVRIQEIDERFDLSVQVFARREERGWTQEDLAGQAGLTQSQVAKIEAGHSNPTLRTIVKLAHALETGVHELFEAADGEWEEHEGDVRCSECGGAIGAHLQEAVFLSAQPVRTLMGWAVTGAPVDVSRENEWFGTTALEMRPVRGLFTSTEVDQPTKRIA